MVVDREEAEQAMTQEIRQRIREERALVLGLATGRTMEGIYARLVAERADFRSVTTFNLDEFRGLSAKHPASFRTEMRERLFRHIGPPEKRTHFPVPKHAQEPISEACERYEHEIRRVGGIDLQLLGIGRNGHLAFNEPGSAKKSRTREVELASSTREDAEPRFAHTMEDVPERAWTMGVATILEAKALRVLAFGSAKADIVAAALEGPIGPDLPASFVRLHPSCEIWLDREAARSLTKKPS